MKIRKLLNAMVIVVASTVLLLQQGRIQTYALEKNAEVNEKNILELLDEYDSDGAYIIRFGIEHGDNVLEWFENGTTIIDDIETAVHEETHGYILQNHRANEEEIYVGNEQGIHVAYTEIFDSQEMTTDIPDELRTFRFDTYIGDPDENMASNIDGVYGLLNEFTAYCWDLNNTVCLYDYYKAEANTPQDWLDYINKFNNGRMAYSEFNFYILKYLEYAKVNHPDIYEDIVTSKSFAEAYTTIENKYRSLTETADQYIEEIIRENNGKKENGSIFIGSSGISFDDEDYIKLINETSNPEYQEIYQVLSGNSLPIAVTITTTSTNSNSSSQIITTTALSTTYSYSNIISAIGSGEEEEKSWFTMSNIVLMVLWMAFLSGIIVIVFEVIRGQKRGRKES